MSERWEKEFSSLSLETKSETLNNVDGEQQVTEVVVAASKVGKLLL